MRLRLGALDREIVGLAIPALGALAIDPLLTLADTAFVARLGTTELAALGVDTAILSFAFFAFNFLAYVLTPLVAKAISSGDVERARRWVGDAILLAGVLGILVWVVIEVLAPSFVSLMGASGEVADPAVEYLRIRAFAAPAVLFVTVGHGAFRGHKDTRTPLRVALGVNLLNLALDPVLIFVAGLGLAGAALATVVAQYVGAVWFFRLLRRREMITSPQGMRALFESAKSLGGHGALLTIRTGLLLLAFTVAAATATRLGPVQIAAHQIVAQVFLLAALMADSVAISAQALVGEASGRRDLDRLHHVNIRLIGWGVLAGVFLTLLMFLAAGPISALGSEAAVQSTVREAMAVVAWLQPVAAVLFVADGIFLGMLALRPMVVSTGLGAAAAVFLMQATRFGESVNGIWWAIGALLVVRGIVFLVLYPASARTAVRS